MGQKYTAFLIWRYLRRHRFSALATLLAVTFGVATFFTILSVMEGYRVKLRVLVRGLESHLSLVSNPALTLQGAEEFQRIVEGVPHVVATAPFIQTIALYNSFGSFSYLEVKGIDPVREAKVGDLEFHLFRSEELEERIFKEEFEEPDQGSSPGERAVPSREELE